MRGRGDRARSAQHQTIELEAIYATQRQNRIITRTASAQLWIQSKFGSDDNFWIYIHELKDEDIMQERCRRLREFCGK